MKKVSTVAVKQSRNIFQPKLTIGLDLGDRMRGNIFFGIACGFLVAFAISVWSLIRRKTRGS
jgi:hypothetical protein